MIVVVAGIVVRDGRIMICQRKPGGPEGGKWEFPGGKIEAGETPEQALERELSEELGIRTRTGRVFDVKMKRYPDRDILLLFYFSCILEGEPRPIDCQDVAWVEPGKLASYDLASMDALVAAQLAQQF